MKAVETGFNPTYHEDAPAFEDVSEIKGFAIIEFGAPWCGYCQAAEPLIEQVLSKHTFPHIKIFDGKGKRLGRAFQVKLWPSLILLHDGLEVGRIVRPDSTQDIEDLISRID
ncbi:thioredoxin family protein [Enterovibrio coralii]|uniref:Thioredoxin n=1 Tax=Enterovibrio coralii TaxID=294935 RepID=A0A135I8A9_9GAMM|nr:thioredoxin family protein [Enterovibrio coralii]KXF81675.1 thioredoxin [Enterovibrio coralii]